MESDQQAAADMKAKAEAEKAAGQNLHDGQHPIADYSFAHGGSFTGPTADVDDAPLAAGDKVVVVSMRQNHGDVLLDKYFKSYEGKHGVLEWAQDVFPFAQVIIVFPDNPELDPLNTFSQHVRKEV